jgi:hypothetical protein
LNLSNQKVILGRRTVELSAVLKSDEQSVCERLEAWELRFQRILALYNPDGSLPADLRPSVRAAYSALKLNVRAAFKVGDSDEGRAQMSDAEARFYHPAIRDASALLVARAESPPEAWHRSLCDALTHISDAIVHLTEQDAPART